MQKICICSSHMKRGYSGGRYCAWILGEALAAAGYDVTVWTNAYPKYAEDFADYPCHGNIRCHVDPRFRHMPNGRFEWVLVVPDHSSPARAYRAWLDLASCNGAQVALLNFETPNWFNSIVDVPADENLWENWKLISRYCNRILSLTEEGTKFAKKFYAGVSSECRFVSCPPSINSKVADSADDMEREKQIFVITRLGGHHSRHKGADNLIAAIGPAMTGYELVILAERSRARGKISGRIRKAAAAHGVKVRLLSGLTDAMKFREIRKSKLMLFLSEFEGFGYPPVEALYCNTPCIVYDLPVLREISGGGLTYVQPGDSAGLSDSIARELSRHDDGKQVLRTSVMQTATFESFVVRLSGIFAA